MRILDNQQGKRQERKRRSEALYGHFQTFARDPMDVQRHQDDDRARRLPRGQHFYRVGRKIMFKWEAAVAFIENQAVAAHAFSDPR